MLMNDLRWANVTDYTVPGPWEMKSDWRWQLWNNVIDWVNGDDLKARFVGHLGHVHACLRFLYPVYSNIQRAKENEAVLQPFHDHTKAVFDAILTIQAIL